VTGEVRGGKFPVFTAAIAENVTLTRGRTRLGCECFLEPWVLIGGVVGHNVDNHPNVSLVEFVNELVELLQGPDFGVDVAIVGDVVTTIG